MSENSTIQEEIKKRKTFAIISHPDAGKTTITEKLLLFGGAIQMAGTVKAKKSKKYATSDWMEIEKQRGISVTSSVMKFIYRDHEINLLDTPGHQDFSEDTYRVLTAVDSALMVIDSVKGVEAQTIKLLEVCRLRHTPVMTFVNKLDREGKNPFDLIDEIEKILKISCSPVTWPIGMGKEFKGVYDILNKKIQLFTAGEKSGSENSITIDDLHDPQLDELVGSSHAEQLREDLELLEGAGHPFSSEDYLAGISTPVFFGSAINNFGVQEFLDNFLNFSPAPLPRKAQTREVHPDENKLTGFVFKIQANMDPNHRDRIAFFRICSGKFTRGMKVYHSRLKRDIKLNNTITFMAQDRQKTEEAFAGDILGLHDPGLYKIGDTFSMGEDLSFTGIPHFAPEHFMKVRLANPLKMKQLEKGLDQLSEEGATQVFRLQFGNEPILGVVGVLQFDVIKFRLQNEYSVEGVFEPVPYNCARWYHSDDEKELKQFEERYVTQIAMDVENKKTFLANSIFDLDFIKKKFNSIEFYLNSDHIPL